MTAYNDNLAALIGSRICHDLISPVGAVANGLELLELGGVPRGPEMALVSESAANAGALIRLFRLAFGLAGGTQAVGSEEMAAILRDVHHESRTRIVWSAQGAFPRRTAQIVMLGALCADRALAFGGTLEVGSDGGGWRISARSGRLSADPALWSLLSGGRTDSPLAPADVQFALLPRLLADEGKLCRHTITADTASLSF